MTTRYGEFAYHRASGHGLANNAKRAYGRYSFDTSVLVASDIYKLIKLPKQCIVTGGALWADDLDTGTEALDIDLGWADNGGASETHLFRLEGASRAAPNSLTLTNMFDGAAAAAGFINTGVWNGDVITDLVAAGINYRPIPMNRGPYFFSRDTDVQLKINVAANVQAAGIVWVYLDYVAC